jgi:quercetin dioxygenase-like cupin family protein
MTTMTTINPASETLAPEVEAAAAVTVVRPGNASVHQLGDSAIETLLFGSRAPAAFDVIRGTVAPGGGPPPHIHRREDEITFVVDGEFEYVVGEQIIRASAGTCLFLPRNVVHHFRNVGTTTGTLLGVATPGGFASFIEDGGVRIADRHTAPVPRAIALPKLAAASARHHIELLPTWVASDRAAPRAPRRSVNVFGLNIRLLLTSDETRGQFCVAEVTARPGDAVLPHSHRREDEIFHVLDGAFEFELPSRTVVAPAGTFVHVPRNTMHGFRNVSSTSAKLLDMHTPGGFESFFVEAGASDLSDPASILSLLDRHAMDVPAPTNA